MKSVLITGATRGIGFEAAASLAAQGVRPILVGRHAQRLARAVAEIRTRTGVQADARLCDLASLNQVRCLSDDIRRDYPRLDVLINNAGGVHPRRTLTEDGYETTFATNHLAHFLLTTRLLDLIRASAPARIVTVASIAHRRGALEFDNLDLKRGYGAMRAYSQSKLANVLFARELARRLAGTGVTSNSVHPGGVATHIWSGAPLPVRPFIRLWAWQALMPAAAGAVPVVQLATRADLADVTGRYFEGSSEIEPSSLAQDADLGARLWQVSERLVDAAPLIRPQAL